MLCSRFSFRLSVRQVVSRVILRGSALHYFAQRPIWAHDVHDQLLHGPVVLQSLAELGHIQQADGVGPLHDLVETGPNTPHLPDQHRHIGGWSLFYRRTVEDAAAVPLTGQAGLADLFRQCFQFIFSEVDLHAVISFSHNILLDFVRLEFTGWHIFSFSWPCVILNTEVVHMTAQHKRRIAAVKTADAINAIEGAPVSRYAQALSQSWARGEISGAQMKAALLVSHAKLAAQVRKHG